VISRFLPHEYEADFASLYAFCRCADDAADERASREAALTELDALSRIIDGVFGEDGVAETIDDCASRFARYIPAWTHLIRRRSLPRAPFDALLRAFRQDQHTSRYENMHELLDYCAGSANPVGRLVLLITGHASHPDPDRLFDASDATCTALQLTNFWQDVARDLVERDRIYIPGEMMRRFDLEERSLRALVDARRADRRFVHLERALVELTRPYFARGRALWPLAKADVRPTLCLFTLGGEAVLRTIERAGYDVLRRRPTISKFRNCAILTSVWFHSRFGVGARATSPSRSID
jgi:squalene synthase HpnC